MSHGNAITDTDRRKFNRGPTGSSYTMDHTAHSYVFDPQGRLRLALRHEQTPQDYAHDISLLLKAPH